MTYEYKSTIWKRFPNGTRSEGHLFVIPDIHGQAGLLEAMLDHVGRAPRQDGDRTIVFLGDLMDRGPENFRSIRLALGAKSQCENLIILPGNHEGMLLDGLIQPLESGALQYWINNGGHSVVNEISDGSWGNAEELRQALRDAFPEGYLDFLETAPSHYLCGDLLLVHAGICPPIGMKRQSDLARFLAQPLRDAQRMHWAWIRGPFLNWSAGWDEARRKVVVHGHTVMCDAPLRSTEEVVMAADYVESHARLSLDLGATFFGHLVALEVSGCNFRFHMVRDLEFSR